MTKRLIVFVLVTAYTLSYAESVTRIVFVNHSPAVNLSDGMTWPESFDTARVWLGKTEVRYDEPMLGYRFIVNDSLDSLYMVHPKFEVYAAFDREGKWRADEYDDAEQQDFVSGVDMLMTNDGLEIVETTDTLTVRGVKCHRFEFITQDKEGIDTSDVWISDHSDQQVQMLYLAYYCFELIGSNGESIEEELKQVNGFPMLEVSRGKIRKTSEIISIDTVTVDSTFFRVPAHYERFKL